MSDKNNGGQAFPSLNKVMVSENISTGGHPGMTLRQYYAIKALQGMLSNSQLEIEMNELDAKYTQQKQIDAQIKVAFAYADGMLKHEEEGK